MKASIITPVWNRADLTFNFLNQHIPYRELAEIIIVDNGSVDGTSAVLQSFEHKLNLAYVRNEQNTGFGPANNQGAKLAGGDVLIFLNNDIKINGNYISPIIRQLEQQDIITGAELLDYDTGWNVFDGQIIRYIHGWSMAMRRATFDKLGGFDERYIPGDYEDIDICYNATRKGYSLQAINLPLRHMSGQTARQLPDRRAITEKHRALFAQKWGFNGNGHKPT